MRVIGPILMTSILLSACGSSECNDGEASCSADGLVLTTCVDGKFETVACMADHGQLCETGACVDPWRYGSPEWSTCPDETRGTAESLVDKATYYDEIAQRLHVHPQLKWAMGVTLKAGADPETATWQDVERWSSGENDGLWSALYLASQAYRYAVTKDDDALAMVKLLLDGERDRMNVTGVPGMFTRQLIPPGIDGIECPTSTAAYAVDAEKDDNRWLQIREDGCAWVVDRDTGAWTETDHCVSTDFANYCWLDNVSKDEYSGHMFALAVVDALVDDPEVDATVRELAEPIGALILANGLAVRDWDGRITEHGRFHPQALDNFPGFNAAMALGYLNMVQRSTGDETLRQTYDECLLMSGGPKDCYDTGFLEIIPFPEYLEEPGLYLGSEGCLTNYNNVSMHMLSMHILVSTTRDPKLRRFYQDSLDVDVVRDTGEPRTVINQNNAFFDFIWAANKALGPDTDGPAFDAVENGVCMLKQFPARQVPVERTVAPELTEPYCLNRFDRDTGEHAREVADRCVRNFLWWGDPYDLRECTANPTRVEVPTDYLLAYWMGRYYGFVAPAQ